LIPSSCSKPLLAGRWVHYSDILFYIAMTLQYDAEYLLAIQKFASQAGPIRKHELHDVASRREMMNRLLPGMMSNFPEQADVIRTQYQVKTGLGHQATVHRFAKSAADNDQGGDTKPGPAIFHCHGGGMILGSVDAFARYLAFVVSKTSVPVYSVDYRLAPEHPYPAVVEDCYASLGWLRDHAKEFGVDPARIAVMGESAGGGIAAGLALMARDQGLQPPVAKQILICPMLDDRTVEENPAIEPFAVWTTEDNITGWTAVLGAEKMSHQDRTVSPYAAAARAESVTGLPPTYIEIGELDIFRDECIEYAMRIARENISTELHLYPGVPHGFEMFASNIALARSAFESRLRAIGAL
jgi:acetyl esterase/lipase